MDISDKVISALRWATIARFGAQLISWCVTIFVIRILTPEDYGMIAMVAVVTSFLVLINSLGQDAVLVQRPNLSDDERQRIFGIVVTINLAFFAILQLGATTIAEFYSEPRLVDLIRVLAFQFVVLIFETLPLARLEREMHFKGRSIVDLVSALMASVCTLVLALAGYGVWALAWGTLLTVTTRTIGLYMVSPSIVWPKFSLTGLRSVLSFGGFVSADRALWFTYSESDKFIGGKIMGTEPLGIYAVAHHLASLPIYKLMGIINAVAFPAFSYANANSDRVGEYLIIATRVLCTVAFPVFFGMSAVAPELVMVLLGEKWIEATVALQLLALVMPLRMLANVFSPTMFGIGRPEVSARNNFIAVLILPVMFIIGAQWGIAGLSMAWVVGFPLLFLVFVTTSCAQIKVPTSIYLLQLLWPLLLSAAMYGVVTLTRSMLPDLDNTILRLVLLIMIGAGFYAAAVSIFHREGVRDLMDVARRGANLTIPKI